MLFTYYYVFTYFFDTKADVGLVGWSVATFHQAVQSPTHEVTLVSSPPPPSPVRFSCRLAYTKIATYMSWTPPSYPKLFLRALRYFNQPQTIPRHAETYLLQLYDVSIDANLPYATARSTHSLYAAPS